MAIYPPLGMPNRVCCNVCGGRVYRSPCPRHDQPVQNKIGLRDKYASIFFVRYQESRP